MPGRYRYAGAACGALLTALACAAPALAAEATAPPDGDRAQDAVAVPPPPFKEEDVFPCQECHADEKPKLRRRALDEHPGVVLEHGEHRGWCFDCHNPEDRDHLRLSDGTLVPFERSYVLCGQCHGLKLRDWRAGVHGKRTGSWNGPKQYRLCVHCHDPHAPRFRPIAPEPPPRRPLPPTRTGSHG